jgi:tetratricopeptide (TPR) repeat protein
MIRGTVEVVSSRFSLYRNSLNLFNDYLFTGIGLGDTFAMVYSHYQLMFHVPFLFYAHNLFLAVALGQGILGLVALIWLVFSFFGFVYQVEQSSLNDEALSIFRAAWLGVTITFIHGLTDAPQFSPDRWTMVMLFALLGLTVAAGKSVLRQEESEYRTSSGLSLWRATPWKWAGLAVFGFTMIFLIFGNGLLSIFYANIGSVYQSRADLSSQLDNVAREAALAQSIVYFERALKFNPSQPVANRRLGLIALEQQRYDMAVGHLEQAHLREPQNQATLKSLGYGYLWSGNLPAAIAMFRQVEMRDFLRQELVYWQWQWREQGREDLAGYAQAMLQALSEKSQ